MPLDRPTKKDPDEEEPENFWKGLARDLLVAGIIVTIFLASIYLYAGVWPPLVVVESSSMQHADRDSSLGVIDTGDMVFQQAAPDRSSIVTYLEGRSTGYTTYGDYGDVIIFRRTGNPTPVIHRAIMFVRIYANGTADVPDLPLLASDWEATNSTGTTAIPLYLRSLTIHHMGFDHNLGITFDFASASLARFGPRSGYITMGDHNAYLYCSTDLDPCRNSVPYDTGWVPRQEDIVGRARGEIPWFGLLKLTLQPTDSCCPGGWGDPEAPKNSWDSLLVSLIVLFALPFILEYAGHGWTKYVSPRLPEIRWPWRRKAKVKASKGDAKKAADGPKQRDKKPPKEGSSGS